MHPTLPSQPDPLERLARKRAGAKLGWYTHAGIYLLVNLFLAFVSSRSSHAWAIYPALGWGLGLLIHGAAVWLAHARRLAPPPTARARTRRAAAPAKPH
jgi:hypothetical protein